MLAVVGGRQQGGGGEPTAAREEGECGGTGEKDNLAEVESAGVLGKKY